MASQMCVGNVRFFQLLQEQTNEREAQKNQEPGTRKELHYPEERARLSESG